MSNIKIVDAIIDSKTGKAGLVIEEAGQKYVQTSKGISTFAEHATQTREVITGAKAQRLSEQALFQVVGKTDGLPEAVRNNLHKVEGVFAGADAELLAKLGEKTTLLKAIEKGEKAGIQAVLETDATLIKGLSADKLDAVKKAGVDVEAITKNAEAAAKTAAEVVSKAEALTKAKDGLKTILEAKKIDHKALADYLTNNAEHLDEFAKMEAPAGVQLKSAISKVQGEISTATTKAQGLVTELAADHSALGKLEALGGNADEIKTLKEGIETSTKELTTITDGKLGKVVKKSLDADAVTRLGGHNPSLASKLGAEAVEVAGKSKWYNITKSAGELAEAGFKPEQLKGIKGLWNNRTFTGKAAILGIPAVAIVAAVGSKGKHTDRIQQQQQMAAEQGAALGA